jgi:lincosamide nucleotidyltransferase A/C/D/E
MSEVDVSQIVDLLGRKELDVWVDGGWGVDALLQETTRPHRDLDLVVRLDQVEIVRAALTTAGFDRVLRDWLPVALALADDAGREIDLHPVSRTDDGGGDQALPAGGSFHYPPPTTGVIGGRVVRCVDLMTQVNCHTGYEPTNKDRADLHLSERRFGIDLPDSYR